MIMLKKMDLRRISAEIPGFLRACLPARVFRASVLAVAGPSKHFLATSCENRYPSPSKRSGHSLVRPLGVSAVRRWFAGLQVSGKKPFALHHENRAHGGIINTKKGKRACIRNFGSSPLAAFSHWLPVVTQCLNRDCWALAQVPVPRLFWAATPPPARLLAVRQTFCIASKTRHSAKLRPPSGGYLRCRSVHGHRGISLMAAIGRGGDGQPALAGTGGLRRV